MLRSTILALAALVSFNVLAADYSIHHCKVTYVAQNNPYEEGLGRYDDRDTDGDSRTIDVDIYQGKLNVSVGQMNFGLHAPDGIVASKDAKKNDVYKIVPTDGGDELKVVITPGKTAVVYYKAEIAQKKFDVIARGFCGKFKEFDFDDL